MASDHEKLGRVVPGRTMKLDAMPDELFDGDAGDDSGYALADEGSGLSAPPPLPPRGSGAPPAGSQAPPAGSQPPPAGGDQKKTMVIAIVVAVLMAVAGIGVGLFLLGEDEEPMTEPPPSIELGDIEVQSH